MNPNARALPAAEAAEFPQESAPVQAPATGHDHPFVKLHRILAGRYHWAILLGLLLGGAAGGAAHYLVKNVYRSPGALQIAPMQSDPLLGQVAIMPMYNSYMDAQVQIITSTRTIQMAMESPDWKAAMRKAPPHSLNDFTDGLKVKHERDGEVIEISYDDRDPQVAAAAVQSIVDAYMRIHTEFAATDQQKTFSILEDERKRLTDLLTDQNQKITDIAGKYATDDLNQIFTAKLELCIGLERNISEKMTELAMAQAAESTSTRPATGPAPVEQLTPEIIAARGDRQMGELLVRRDQLAAQVESLTAGYGSMYPSVQRAQADLNAVVTQIEKLKQKYQAAATQPGLAMPLQTASTQMTAAQLQRLIDTLKVQYEATQKEMNEVGTKALQIGKIKREVSVAKDELDQVKSQLNKIQIVALVASKPSVVAAGIVPTRPVKDKNRTMTMVGGAGGMMLGVCLVALVGLLDRRLRSVADAQTFFDRSNRVLGILPALPEDLTDPEQAAMAAYCVHHIRTLLQLGAGPDAHPVIAVTSAGPRDGKTSLVLSLGHSYAATGAKTLIIDFDLVGMGLTSRAGVSMRRPIGDLLLREGRIKRDQLEEAQARSLKTGRHLGQSLIEMGLITSADLDALLETQRGSTLGLLDVLEGEPLADCLAAGGNNLSVLTVGDVGKKHVGQLSLQQVQRIFREARRSFDVVLIDTGPVLGSLESCIVTAVADEVILVVARGQHRPLIDKALKRLTDIGAKMAGIVFNRAGQGDLEDSDYSSYRNSQRLVEVSGANGRRERTRRLGPVARAVVDAEPAAEVPAEDSP
jgi:polysaccharide biosynthesis transport protein